MADNTPTSAEALLNGAQAQAQQAADDIVRKYDLLPKMIPHFDRHLVFPLLEFHTGTEIESAEDMIKSKYELLKQTNMTDYVANLWREIHDRDDVPEEFVKKREEVLQRLQLFHEESSKITELLEEKEVVDRLRSDKVANLQFLKEHHGVTIEMINILYDFGRFQYSCGSYANAAELLYQFRVLVSRSVFWGRSGADGRSPPTTTRCRRPRGASWRARSSAPTGRQPWRRCRRSRSRSTPR